MESVTRTTYDPTFFDSIREGSRRSALAVVPHVLEFVSPQRVIDVGCGVGTWLRVFNELGNCDVTGIDGDYVRADDLEIDPRRFIRHDLQKPLKLDGRWNLAVSLEVAEHLDPEAADGFVEALAALAPVVLFSAAIPYQGGVDHRNEQWPAYWRERFAQHGMTAVDCIRPRIWNDERVEWWYAQNILLFVDEPHLFGMSALRRAQYPTGDDVLHLIHPRHYVKRV